MTRVTFGISASSFAANMSMKQNAVDFGTEYPLAAKAVDESFYVDDCLSGANTIEEVIKLATTVTRSLLKSRFSAMQVAF